MKQISDFFDKVYLIGAWLSGGLLVLLCLLIVYSILARLFGWYAGGATDFAGYVMGASTFLALAYTFRMDGHIRILLFVQKTYGPLRVFLERWGLFIMSALSIYLAFYMTRLALDSFEYGERSEGADAVLLWIPQTPLAFGACVFAFAVTHTFIESIFDPEKADPERLANREQEEI
ncbi:MAG: TRAP transporter small permease [Methylocystaceae bacterium]|nr:TRAP transporter small permease [Methylocystaceae bacterium]